MDRGRTEGPPTSPEASPPPRAGEAPGGRRATAIEKRRVPGVGEVWIAEGARESTGVLVYLHGRCGDPEAFQAFVASIPPSLTLVSVRGDVKCKGSERTRWSVSPAVIDARVRKAVEAVSERRARPLQADGWLVFGYSEGALRAEALLARHPDRYVAGVLAGGPRAPRRGTLLRARRVVFMAGSLDARGHLQKAAEDLAAAGVEARFDLLPGARHGEYGPDGETVVGGALTWLLDGAPSFTNEGRSFQN